MDQISIATMYLWSLSGPRWTLCYLTASVLEERMQACASEDIPKSTLVLRSNPSYPSQCTELVASNAFGASRAF